MSNIAFDRIKKDVDVLAKTVFQQLNYCKQIIDDQTLAQKYIGSVEDNERMIDSLEVKLRSEVISSIVLYSPRATDLRKIIAYYDITNYMERIADHALNVCQFMENIENDSVVYKNTKIKLLTMLDYVDNMTKNAIFAIVCKDNRVAAEVMITDVRVNTLNKEICESLVGAEPVASVKSSLLLNAIATNLERIGDNATNIAEAAIYIIDGKDIKHKFQTYEQDEK